METAASRRQRLTSLAAKRASQAWWLSVAWYCSLGVGLALAGILAWPVDGAVEPAARSVATLGLLASGAALTFLSKQQTLYNRHSIVLRWISQHGSGDPVLDELNDLERSAAEEFLAERTLNRTQLAEIVGGD